MPSRYPLQGFGPGDSRRSNRLGPLDRSRPEGLRPFSFAVGYLLRHPQRFVMDLRSHPKRLILGANPSIETYHIARHNCTSTLVPAVSGKRSIHHSMPPPSNPQDRGRLSPLYEPLPELWPARLQRVRALSGSARAAAIPGDNGFNWPSTPKAKRREVEVDSCHGCYLAHGGIDKVAVVGYVMFGPGNSPHPPAHVLRTTLILTPESATV